MESRRQPAAHHLALSAFLALRCPLPAHLPGSAEKGLPSVPPARPAESPDVPVCILRYPAATGAPHSGHGAPQYASVLPDATNAGPCGASKPVSTESGTPVCPVQSGGARSGACPQIGLQRKHSRWRCRNASFQGSVRSPCPPPRQGQSFIQGLRNVSCHALSVTCRSAPMWSFGMRK